ncbi:MAG: hypothetical protein ACE5I1_17975 [bacterium]
MSQNHKTIEVTEKLIQEHFEEEPSLEQVIWINPEHAEEIRLLEINSETFKTDMVQSFYFPPSDEIPYAMFLAEVTPEKWQKVLQNEIPLPEEWTLKNYKVYLRETIPA